MLGERIVRARNAVGLSQRGLAERFSLSAMAISKYERDEVVPASDQLLRLAQALGVRIEYFFRDSDVELRNVEYRTRKPLKVAAKRQIEAEVADHMERWQELEALLPSADRDLFIVPDHLPEQIMALEEMEEIALLLRDAWNLGHNPIPNLIDALEAHGVRVFTVDGDEEGRFDGLSATCCNDMPVVVVGRHWPGDRQRFTLAHELGHLVLEGRLAEGLDEEKFANRFAGAFLVPEEEMYRALGQRRKEIDLQELMLLKREVGASVQALLYRIGDLGILPFTTRQQMWRRLKKQGLFEEELGDLYPPEQTHLFMHRVYRAVAEGLIGDGKGAELLGIPVSELRRCRHQEC